MGYFSREVGEPDFLQGILEEYESGSGGGHSTGFHGKVCINLPKVVL